MGKALNDYTYPCGAQLPDLGLDGCLGNDNVCMWNPLLWAIGEPLLFSWDLWTNPHLLLLKWSTIVQNPQLNSIACPIILLDYCKSVLTWVQEHQYCMYTQASKECIISRVPYSSVYMPCQQFIACQKVKRSICQCATISDEPVILLDPWLTIHTLWVEKKPELLNKVFLAKATCQ